MAEGVEQTVAYMDRCGVEQGHLVIFDPNKDKTWAEKIFRVEEMRQSKVLRVWGI